MGLQEIIESTRIKQESEIKPATGEAEQDFEETDFYRFEGLRNSINRLQIFTASGGIIAIEYSMMPVIFSPSDDEIVIPTMLNLKITISGNNLERLRKRLIDNRVKWMKAYVGTKPPIEENDLFIETIKIEAKPFDEAIEKLVQ